MTADTRTIAASVLAGAIMTALVVAQGVGTPAPQGQPVDHTGAPAARSQRGGVETPTPPPGGRAGDPGQRGAPPEGGRQGRGGRAGGYTQYTRPPASEDVVIRGKALYGANCASCHAIDLRGTPDGKNPNLLRSGVALRDQKGELIGARVVKHTPAHAQRGDTIAIAEYIHSVHATMGGQGSPPGRNPTNVTLNVLVGNPKNGKRPSTPCACQRGRSLSTRSPAAAPASSRRPAASCSSATGRTSRPGTPRQARVCGTPRSAACRVRPRRSCSTASSTSCFTSNGSLYMFVLN